MRASNERDRGGRGRAEHKVKRVSGRGDGFAGSIGQEKVALIKAMDDPKSMHLRLGIKNTRARRKNPDMRDGEGVRAPVIRDEGDESFTSGRRAGRTVGSVNSVGGRRGVHYREIGDIRYNKMSGLRVNKG